MATSAVHTPQHYPNIFFDEDYTFRIKDMMKQANKQKTQNCVLYLEVATSVTRSSGMFMKIKSMRSNDTNGLHDTKFQYISLVCMNRRCRLEYHSYEYIRRESYSIILQYLLYIFMILNNSENTFI